MNTLQDILGSARLIELVISLRRKKNPLRGECYVASVVLYDMHDGKNMTLVKKLDCLGNTHWWVVYDDGENHINIDITQNQYYEQNLPCPSHSPEDVIEAKKMGFASYKKRIKELEEEIWEYMTCVVEMECELAGR